MEVPKLIENQTKYYLWRTLQECHDKRKNWYIFFWNMFIFLTFISVFGMALYLCAIRKKQNVEDTGKFQRDQEYILNKIRAFKEQDSYRKQSQSMTQLPYPVSESLAPDIIPDPPSGYVY
jgi:F0F1-type ATP synthase membrane subunit a